MARVHKLTLEPMTEESFAPFGEIWDPQDRPAAVQRPLDRVLPDSAQKLQSLCDASLVVCSSFPLRRDGAALCSPLDRAGIVKVGNLPGPLRALAGCRPRV